MCDIVNQYGDKKGFQLIEEKFEKTQDLTAKAMAALLQPLVNCANLLVAYTAQLTLPAWSLLSNLLRILNPILVKSAKADYCAHNVDTMVCLYISMISCTILGSLEAN